MLLRYELGSRNKIFFMHKTEIIIWEKYNRLTIFSESVQRWYDRYILCKCDCWNDKVVRIDHIKSGRTKSCWCLMKDTSYKIHWLSETKIYNVYRAIINRCNNIKHKSYKDYWGRWIKCEWNSFEEFYRDMWESYNEWLQIDRINNNWNYCKKNCKWSNRKENCRNRRNTMYIWLVPLVQYCEDNNLNYKNTSYLYRKWRFII